jgi:hypothetical protein
MKTRMGLVLLAVMMAMALGHVQALSRCAHWFSRFRFGKRVKFLLRRFPTAADDTGQGVLLPKNRRR